MKNVEVEFYVENEIILSAKFLTPKKVFDKLMEKENQCVVVDGHKFIKKHE